MFWVIIALTALFFWALVNIGDKYIVSHKIRNPYVYLTWLTFLGLASLLIIPFINFSLPDKKILLWLVIAGAVYFFGGLPYIKAVKVEEVTRVNILWNLIPVMSLVLAWVTLGEQLNLWQVLALFIMVFGGILASVHFKTRGFVFSRAFWLMLLSSASYSVYGVIFRYITQNSSWVNAYVLLSLVMSVCAATLFLRRSFRQDFLAELKNLKPVTGWVTVGVSAADHLGILFNLWALSLGPVALIHALEGFQALFAFILVCLLARLAPSILREDFSRKNLALKLVALLLMFLGLVILNLA